MSAVRPAKYNLPPDDMVHVPVEPLVVATVTPKHEELDISAENSQDVPLTPPDQSYQDSPFTTFFSLIGNLSQLEDNWNSYGAAAPNKTAIFWAHRVLEQLLRTNFTPRTVSASSDDGVAIFFLSGNKRASIECLNSGEILGVFFENDNPLRVWTIHQSHLRREIRTIQTLFTR